MNLNILVGAVIVLALQVAFLSIRFKLTTILIILAVEAAMLLVMGGFGGVALW